MFCRKLGLAAGLPVFFCLSATAAPDVSKLPPEARELLAKVPSRALTSELILGLAAQGSDSFRALQATVPLVEVGRLQGSAPLDTQIKAATLFQWDRLESANPMNYERLNLWASNVEASRYFASGTALSAKLNVGRSQLAFPPAVGFPEISTYETKFELSVAQNLWRDAFGEAVRAGRSAGEATSRATEARLRESVEDWALGLLRQFYLAWQLQDRVYASDGALGRQRRLLDISRVKSRRGTAESQDLLRIESSFLNADTQRIQAENQLREAWTNLVIALRLPESFLDIEPRNVPIRLDDPLPEAQRLCRADFAEIAKTNATLLRFRLEAEAAERRAAASSSQARPSLQLVGGVGGNGMDPTFGSTPREAFSLDHPSYFVGLQFSMSLSSRAEEAQVRGAMSDKIRTEALASQAEGQLKAEWRNACRELSRLDRARRQSQEISEKQARRERIEENLFGIGRTTTFGVIQAGDEASFARLAVTQAEVDLRMTAWKVRRMAGQIPAWLESLAAEADRMRKSL